MKHAKNYHINFLTMKATILDTHGMMCIAVSNLKFGLFSSVYEMALIINMSKCSQKFGNFQENLSGRPEL